MENRVGIIVRMVGVIPKNTNVGQALHDVKKLIDDSVIGFYVEDILLDDNPYPFVLDRDEISNDKCLFCEFRHGISPQYESPETIISWLNNPRFKYGTTWRCWSKEPSAERMLITPWDD